MTMRRFTLVLSASLALVAMLAVVAGAAPPRRPARERAEESRPAAFMVSGAFSGVLAGEVSLNGDRFRIARDASFYEIGLGPLSAGQTVSVRLVTFTGTRIGDTYVVSGVILRPESEIVLTGEDMSAYVSEKDPDSGE
jgi:hypothetical protein